MTTRRLQLAALLLAGLAAGRAGIIDRIAVSVGNRVITESEIEREARLTAFLNNQPPDFTPAARRKTADRLVEQRLVLRELEAARYASPAESEAGPLFEQVRVRYGTPAAYQEALRKYGITEKDVRDHLLWQLAFLRFIDIRFRPGVQVTDQEVLDYFQKVIRPAARQADPGKEPALEEYRGRIEETLAGQRVDQDLQRWLEAARRRTRVEYREGAFQ